MFSASSDASSLPAQSPRPAPPDRVLQAEAPEPDGGESADDREGERVVVRAENQPALLRLEKSRALARERVVRMRELFRAFEEETFGYF